MLRPDVERAISNSDAQIRTNRSASQIPEAPLAEQAPQVVGPGSGRNVSDVTFPESSTYAPYSMYDTLHALLWIVCYVLHTAFCILDTSFSYMY